MTETIDTNNTIPVDFASAGVTSPRPTFRFLTAQITAAHKELIERLTRLPPNEIDSRLVADAEDLEMRAETLRCHLIIMKDYVSEFVRDTAGYSHAVHVDRKWVEAQFRDLIDDIVGPIDIAAETVRQEGVWAA
jgi:hypothetical protein